MHIDYYRRVTPYIKVNLYGKLAAVLHDATIHLMLCHADEKGGQDYKHKHLEKKVAVPS